MNKIRCNWTELGNCAQNKRTAKVPSQRRQREYLHW